MAILILLGLAASHANASNVIQTENLKPGTTDWQISNLATQGEIEGYASATSVNRGGQISFFVNTSAASYTLQIFRMGWYAGDGGREMITAVSRNGTQQVIPSPAAATGIVECNWTDPYVLNIPASSDATDWASGVYLVKLTAAGTGKQRYIVFVVRDDSRSSAYLFQSAADTYQAYNNWGGKSLYAFNSTGAQATKVSFNRPYTGGYGQDGAGDFVGGWEFNMVRFLEREGMDVTYLTDVDVHTTASLLLTHRANLITGHSEYWSYPMRQGVQSARDQGVGLGFFSGNNIFWQVRFEAASDGTPNRTMVSYKESALTADPYFLDSDHSNDVLVTTQWRNSPVNLPEDALVGVGFVGEQIDSDIIVSNASHWVFANTGLVNGSVLHGLLGYEVDGVLTHTPSGLAVLAHSPFKASGKTQFSDMTVYTGPGSSLVFATGSIQWAWGLDNFGPSRASAAAQQITRNVLARLIGNLPPTSSTTGPYSGKAAVPLFFDGSTSTDPDGSIVEYIWDFGDQSTGTGPTPSHVYSTGGTYTVTLLVRDNSGSTNLSTTTATMAPADAILDISPASVSFPSQIVGTSGSAVPITVKATGTVAIDFAAFDLSGDFTESNNCPPTLNAGAQCTVSIVFAPASTGPHTGAFVITSNASTSPQSVSLSGTGLRVPDLRLDVSPTSLTFASQIVNTSSASSAIVVKAIGLDAVTFSSIAATGDFTQTNNCPAVLNPNAQCTVNVIFTPTVSGARTGSLAILSNASTSPQSVSLSGSGQRAPDLRLDLSPTSLSFASQIVNTSSSSTAVVVKAIGLDAVTFSSISASGDFTQTNDCPAVLNAGAQCTVSLVFTPTVTGSRTGSLSILSNASTSPQSVSLSGTGLRAPDLRLSVSPSSLSFGTQIVGTSSASSAVVVRAIGLDAVTFSSISASGDFTQANDCPAILNPGAQCTVNVIFAPTATGTRAGSVAVLSNASTSPQSVSLTGTARALDMRLDVSPTSLSFGTQIVGTTSASTAVVVKAIGLDAVTFSSISVNGDFAQMNNCPTVLNTGAQCTVSVSFMPSAEGSRTGSLLVNSNATPAGISVGLSGQGIVPRLLISAASIDFGSHFIAQPVPSQTIALTNTGGAPLSISDISLGGAGFSLVPSCPAILMSNESCSLQIGFHPSAPGTYAGTISIQTNASPSPALINLSANSFDIVLTLVRPMRPSRNAPAQASSFDVAVSSAGASVPAQLSCESAPTVICSLDRRSMLLGNATSVVRVDVRENSRASLRLREKRVSNVTITVHAGGAVRQIVVSVVAR